MESTPLNTCDLCILLDKGLEISWVEAKRIKFRGSDNESPMDIASTTFRNLIEDNGLVINEDREPFNPHKPPKYLWLNDHDRYYTIDFKTLLAYYAHMGIGVFVLNLYGEPMLHHEQLLSYSSVQHMHEILKYYGFVHPNQQTVLNISQYHVNRDAKHIVFTAGHQEVLAVNIRKGHLKRKYLHNHTVRLLNYIEAKRYGDFYDQLSHLHSSNELWEHLAHYIKMWPEEFDFLPEDYLHALYLWQQDEWNHMKCKSKDYHPLSADILRIIDYHKRYRSRYSRWIFDTFDPDPKVYPSRQAIQDKIKILTQDHKGDYKRKLKQL